jgi:hypothetical protein
VILYKYDLYLWSSRIRKIFNFQLIEERLYSSVWKQELFLIQSIDWKRIRDADSHMKLLVGNINCVCWKSRLVGGLGGIIVNILVLSVTNGPLCKIDENKSIPKERMYYLRSTCSQWRFSFNRCCCFVRDRVSLPIFVRD